LKTDNPQQNLKTHLSQNNNVKVDFKNVSTAIAGQGGRSPNFLEKSENLNKATAE
jgi:hypothetical protein